MLVTSRKVQTSEASERTGNASSRNEAGSEWVWQQELESLVGSLENIRQGWRIVGGNQQCPGREAGKAVRNHSTEIFGKGGSGIQLRVEDVGGHANGSCRDFMTTGDTKQRLSALCPSVRRLEGEFGRRRSQEL